MTALNSITCGNCGEGIAGQIVAKGTRGQPTWLKWRACEDGCVRTRGGAAWPVAPAGGSVANLPVDVATAWQEARTAHAVAAYTALRDDVPPDPHATPPRQRRAGVAPAGRSDGLMVDVADLDRMVEFVANCIAVASGYTCHPGTQCAPEPIRSTP